MASAGLAWGNVGANLCKAGKPCRTGHDFLIGSKSKVAFGHNDSQGE